MATTIISKLNRKFVVSAATRRYGSPHRLGNGRIGITLETETKVGKLRKASSETNLLGSNIENTFYHQQRSFGTRNHKGGLLQSLKLDPETSSSEPTTVKENVKSVQGILGAAERGFNATYADCIHRICEQVPVELRPWQTKVLTQNLHLSVLGPQRFGILVPITYYQLMPTKPTKEQMTLAHVLGWSVELLRAANTVTNDTIAINTNLENINRAANVIQPKDSHRKKETWVDKNDLGNRAFNDAMTLDQGAQNLIKHYFGNDPALLHHLQQLVLETIQTTTLARSLELTWKEASGKAKRLELPGGMNMAYYDLNTYKKLIQMKYTFIHYCLPVSMALHLGGIHQPEVHNAARKILHQMSYFQEFYHDFANCFENPNGRDIQDGRLTWLIVVACQRANSKQKAILHECYGAGEAGSDAEAKAAAVKKVYKELNLKKALQISLDNTKADVHQRIQSISKIDKIGLSPEFFLKLMDQMSLHDIS